MGFQKISELYQTVDWASTGAWMQAWAGFAGALAVLWVASKGSEAFRIWLHQKQTERRIEYGEKILSLIYKSSDVFKSIRSPGSFGSEIADVEEKLRSSYEGYEELPEGKRRRLQISQTVISRIFSQKEFWAEFWELTPMARVYFGKNFEEQFRTIWKQRAKIYSAASAYSQLDDERGRQEKDPYLEEKNKFEAIFWEGWANAIEREDMVEIELGKLLLESEKIILPILISEIGSDKKSKF